MALATQDDYINAKATSQPPVSYRKEGATKEAAGVYHLPALQPGAPGAWSPGTPGLAGRATDGTTAADGGCIPLKAAGGGKKNRLDALSITALSALQRIQIVDVTWCNSGIVVTTTTAQTWTPVAAAARDADGTANGRGFEIALLVTGATTNGAAVTGATVSYTDRTNGAGRTATVSASNPIPATSAVGTLVFFSLQAGDVDPASIEGITLGTSLGGGSVSLLLLRRLTPTYAVVANETNIYSLTDTGLVEVKAGACLFPLDLAAATTASPLLLTLTSAEAT